MLRRAGCTNIAQDLRLASYDVNHPLTLLASPDFAGVLSRGVRSAPVTASKAEGERVVLGRRNKLSTMVPF
ncbi:MAG: hypothetical protein ACRD1G_06805, partial [Acidimicrobiales bacterium]